MPAPIHQTCTHLRKEHFEWIGEPLWCVRCDGNVFADGTVVPRADTEYPPVKGAFGVRVERFLGQRVPFYKR
jgi:hypothetical protein